MMMMMMWLLLLLQLLIATTGLRCGCRPTGNSRRRGAGASGATVLGSSRLDLWKISSTRLPAPSMFLKDAVLVMSRASFTRYLPIVGSRAFDLGRSTFETGDSSPSFDVGSAWSIRSHSRPLAIGKGRRASAVVTFAIGECVIGCVCHANVL